MKDRIVYIMQDKNISANRLAELMEIQPSSISHILSERNKPSLDFVTKLLTVFPEINPDWLIFGTGHMLRDRKDLIETNGADGNSDKNEVASKNSAHQPQLVSSSENPSRPQVGVSLKSSQNIGRAIRKVMIFYDDYTVESYDYFKTE